jgi:hypothetical protein
MTKKIINLTPHIINIEGQDPIESSGVCRCKEEIEEVGEINGIKIINKSFGEVEGLPEEQEGIIYIVSLPIAQAVKGKRKDCFIPGEIVRDNEGKIVGCLNLASLEHGDMGNVSDGYHTFNELYHHRMMLFAVVCNQNFEISWKSKLHNDGTMFPDYFIVGINTPDGQYTYHYNIKHWDTFKCKAIDKAPEYDGHTPSDIDRLFSLKMHI